MNLSGTLLIFTSALVLLLTSCAVRSTVQTRIVEYPGPTALRQGDVHWSDQGRPTFGPSPLTPTGPPEPCSPAS